LIFYDQPYQTQYTLVNIVRTLARKSSSRLKFCWLKSAVYVNQTNLNVKLNTKPGRQLKICGSHGPPRPSLEPPLAVGLFQGCSGVGMRENGVHTPFCTDYNETWLQSHRCAIDTQIHTPSQKSVVKQEDPVRKFLQANAYFIRSVLVQSSFLFGVGTAFP